jgi:hypothetical protein
MWDRNIAPSEIDRYPAIRMESGYMLNRMDFSAMFLDGGMRGVDSFSFFMRSEAGIRIMVRSGGEEFL